MPNRIPGRVYLFFQKGNRESPPVDRTGLIPVRWWPLDVREWNWVADAGRSVPPTIQSPADLPQTACRPRPGLGISVQAVARFNPLVRKWEMAPGNAHRTAVSPVESVTASRRLQRPAGDRSTGSASGICRDTWCRLLSLRSELLSEFHGRDTWQQAAVLLPASYYDQPDRRYPVIFTVQGFGGKHRRSRKEPIKEQNAEGVEFIRVMLDPSCPLGHHVFADSANNGPVGTALVTEFIPELDRQYRTVAAPTARFLTGHSSGGWSTLWLQVAYPETFGGSWSTAPDPVDFRDFQRIDLYRAGREYVPSTTGRAPAACPQRRNGAAVVRRLRPDGARARLWRSIAQLRSRVQSARPTAPLPRLEPQDRRGRHGRPPNIGRNTTSA